MTEKYFISSRIQHLKPQCYIWKAIKEKFAGWDLPAPVKKTEPQYKHLANLYFIKVESNENITILAVSINSLQNSLNPRLRKGQSKTLLFKNA